MSRQCRRTSVVVGVLALVMLFDSQWAVAQDEAGRQTRVRAGLVAGSRGLEMRTPGHAHRAWLGGARIVVGQDLAVFSTLLGRLMASVGGGFSYGMADGTAFEAESSLPVVRYDAEGRLGVVRPMTSWLRVGLSAGVGLESIAVGANSVYTGHRYIYAPVELKAELGPRESSWTIELEGALMPVVHYVESTEAPQAQAFGARSFLGGMWRGGEGLRLRAGYEYRRFRAYLPLDTGQHSLVQDGHHGLMLGVQMSWGS